MYSPNFILTLKTSWNENCNENKMKKITIIWFGLINRIKKRICITLFDLQLKWNEKHCVLP